MVHGPTVTKGMIETPPTKEKVSVKDVTARHSARDARPRAAITTTKIVTRTFTTAMNMGNATPLSQDAVWTPALKMPPRELVHTVRTR